MQDLQFMVNTPKRKGKKMHPLVALAYTTIAKTLDAGEAKGHGKDSWRDEPKENHAWKSIRHITTAQGVDVIPEFFPDRESAIQFIKSKAGRASEWMPFLFWAWLTL